VPPGSGSFSRPKLSAASLGMVKRVPLVFGCCVVAFISPIAVVRCKGVLSLVKAFGVVLYSAEVVESLCEFSLRKSADFIGESNGEQVGGWRKGVMLDCVIHRLSWPLPHKDCRVCL